MVVVVLMLLLALLLLLVVVVVLLLVELSARLLPPRVSRRLHEGDKLSSKTTRSYAVVPRNEHSRHILQHCQD